MMLPMSHFINHALCDGWHVTRFYKNLDREPRGIERLSENTERTTVNLQ